MKNIPKNDPNNHQNRDNLDEGPRSKRPAEPTPSEAIPSDTPTDAPSNIKPEAENLFARAKKAREERKENPAIVITSKPALIRVTDRLKGWFRTHQSGIFPGIDIFHPKEDDWDEGPKFVTPEVMDHAFGDPTGAFRKVTAYLCVSRQGALYLLLVREMDEFGRLHDAHAQKHEACISAVDKWTAMTWDPATRQYDVKTAVGIPEQPIWPDVVDETTIMSRAFGEKNVIASWDDPLLKRWRGEA